MNIVFFVGKILKFVFAVVFGAVFEVNGEKCTTIIDNRGCSLTNCVDNCKAEFKGEGFCASNSIDGGILVCKCKYDCASF